MTGRLAADAEESPPTPHLITSPFPPPQFLILVVCVVPALACVRRCYNESDLNEVAKRLSKRFPPPPELAPAADGDSPARCPVELYKTLLRTDTRVEQRSVSPWRYV